MSAFEKVIGYKGIKNELGIIVDMMKNPDKYKQLGAKTTHNCLLYGEPGLGKTLMAKCFIEETGRTCFTIRKDTPDGAFVNHIRETFAEAKKQAPSIVFLDDMDKFANEDEDHINAEEFVTIQSCIDDVKDDEVFVIATANDLGCIPDSLLRAGRFDKNIEVEAPKGQDATDIVAYYLKGKKVVKNIKAEDIAVLLNGGSCAQLETVINEAAIIAATKNKECIENDDIINACLRVIYGAPEAEKYDEVEAKKVAVHEAGHAVVSELLSHDVNFVSIRKYDSSMGGFTNMIGNSQYFSNYNLMENRVVTLLAGKAATEIVYGTFDTGAGNDIERAHTITSRFVINYCNYGFDAYYRDREPSEIMKSRSEDKISQEMERFYQKAKSLLIDNRAFFDKVVAELKEKETLTKYDIQRIKDECYPTSANA